MPENHATIFSNGIADFRRSYAVSKDRPAEISIPVRKDHVADVLASLNVYGPVTLTSPPSFRPANEADGSLSFDPGKVLEDLATNLSGAKVTVVRAGGEIEGTLVGLHSEPEATGGERILPKFLVLLNAEGLSRIPLREVSRLRFQDAEVQKELDKALERNVQRIKPHSTFVTLTVATSQDDVEAVLQYTLPAAAWKISYRLRGRPDDGSFELQGFAIVDNNTDEDWTDFRIAVVTGEPITFSTDLADTKIPRRDHVNVVKSQALGSVEVEEGAVMMDASEQMTGSFDAVRRMRKSARATAPGGAAARESVDSYVMEVAETEDAAVREVGDFSVLESPTPVTIAAHRSAVIPVFQTALAEAKSILHYKYDNHAERPFRAVQLKNETTHSLGRGVCTVYVEGVYAGSCVLPAVAAGDEAMLPHALETGVRMHRDQPRRVERVVGLRLTKGFCYTDTYAEQTTHYQVRSSRDETFELVLDHAHQILKPNVVCTVQRENGEASPLQPKEQLKFGVRYYLTLNPRETLRISLTESRTGESRVRLISGSGEELRTDWLETNLVHTNGPLAQEPGVQRCLEIQSRLTAVQEKAAHAEKDRKRLADKQDRLRKNIAAAGQGEQTDRWRTDLARAEDVITEIEEHTLPALRQEEEAIREELREALRSLSAEWRES